MKFLILKDVNDTRAYINTKHIAIIEGMKGEEDDEEDYTALLITGTAAPINIKANVKTVVSVVRLIDHGVTNTDRDYDFEIIQKKNIFDDLMGLF